MKVLFCGDIVGRSGREAVTKNVPRLRRDWSLDFVVVNGENAAAGFGITAKICAELHNAGVDCITTGNHVWDQREIMPYIAQDKRLLRPINFPPGTPGWGADVFQATRGQKIVVINVMCRLFMDAIDDRFRSLDAELAKYTLGGSVNCILVDVQGDVQTFRSIDAQGLLLNISGGVNLIQIHQASDSLMIGHPIQHVLSAASHHRCACLHQKASPGASDGLADSLSEAAPAAFCDMAWHLLIEVSSDQRRSFWLQH